MSEPSAGFLPSKVSHRRPGLPVAKVALDRASSGPPHATPVLEGMTAWRLRVGAGCHAGGVTPVRAMLLDFYRTLVDLSASVRSRGFDDFAWGLGLPLGPGELCRRYIEMITSEPAQAAVPGFEPYRTSWLAAGRRLLAPFGRQSAAGEFADTYADLHATAAIFPEVPDALQVLARHVRIAVVANADHDYLMRCLDHNGLRFDLVVDSETARRYKPDPPIFRRACEALPAGEAVMVGDTRKPMSRAPTRLASERYG